MKMSNSFDESTQKMQIASKIENLLKQFEDEMSDKFKAKSVEGFFDAAIKLCLIFGEELVVEGLSIAENGLVRIVRDEESTFPQVFEVRPGSFCTKSYYIYENINFCNCHFFSDSVLQKNSSFLVGLLNNKRKF